MNKKIIIIVGIVIIVALSSYVFTNQTLFNEKREAIDISDWKSYTNPVTKYQLKYPPYWDAKEGWETPGESGEGMYVSFKDPSGLNSSSLAIYSSPGILGRDWFCWDSSGEGRVKVIVDGFDAAKTTYIPFKDTTPGMPCTDHPTPSSMRFVRVFFEDPNSIFPGSREEIFYEFAFIVDESDLALVDTVISTMLINRQGSTTKDLEIGEVNTDNWRVYKNQVTNYQVSYPTYWEVKEVWKTRVGYGDLYSQEGATVSFQNASDEYWNALTIQSVPILASEFYCWNFRS